MRSGVPLRNLSCLSSFSWFSCLRVEVRATEAVGLGGVVERLAAVSPGPPYELESGAF